MFQMAVFLTFLNTKLKFGRGA